MFIKRDKNEYGTPIITLKCDFCNQVFSVCCGKEHADEEIKAWDKSGCQIQPCKSYNPATDMDKLFSTQKEISNEKVVHIDVLRNRKNLKILTEKL